MDQVLDTNDFKKILDFFVWWFSSSENLVELLVSERKPPRLNRYDSACDKISTYSSGSINKHLDPCYHVSINWKFMREIYLCLEKMVNNRIARKKNLHCFVIIQKEN